MLTDTDRMLRTALAASLLLPVSALAQGALAPPVQYTGQRTVHDVRSTAMGMAGAFLPDASPLAFIENPARLAEAGVSPRLRVTGSGHPNFSVFDGISTAHLAASYAVGPVALGAIVSNLSYGTQTATDELGESLGEFESGDGAFALAAATRLGGPRARIDLGVTGRLSQLRTGGGLDVGGDSGSGTSTAPSLDVGVIASLDVVEAQPLDVGASAPTLTVSAGYAQRYIGTKFETRFRNPDGTSLELLQPRSASLGTSVQFGFDARLPGGRVQILGLDLGIEAESELEYADADGSEPGAFQSGSFVGPLGVADALLGTSGSEFVVGQRGARLTIGEALWLGRGELNQGDTRLLESQTSWGLGASAGGALRLLGTLQERADLVELGQRFDITVGYARLSGINGFRGLRLGSVGVSARL